MGRAWTAGRGVGDCKKCSAPSVPGKAMCRACGAKNLARNQNDRAAQRAAGLCYYPRCPNPPADGRGQCQAHLDRCNEIQRERRARKRKAGATGD